VSLTPVQLDPYHAHEAGRGVRKVSVASRSSALRLEEFTKDARGLDTDSFAARHGVGFFLHYGSLEEEQDPVDLGDTLVSEYTAEAPDVASEPQSNFLVFPVRKKSSEASDQAIWIGRGSQNDIVIPDTSISTMHAFVRIDEGIGTLKLTFLAAAEFMTLVNKLSSG